MRVLIPLLVLIVGGLHVLDGQLATFKSPIVEPLPTLTAPVSLVPTPTSGPVATGSPLQALSDAARSWLGTPYLFGGCSRRGIDCSCLVQTVFALVGVHLPRTTVEQIRIATPVAAADARPGDLVFFDNTCQGCGANPTHVGLVIGAGQMLDAGDPVKLEPIFGGHNARYGRVLS